MEACICYSVHVPHSSGIVSVYLFPVVQALVVVLQDWLALHFTRVVFRVCVYDVAGENLLPEGKAARGTCRGIMC